MAKVLNRRPDGSVRVVTVMEREEGRTLQSFAEQCNINNIMAKYHKGMAVEHLNRRKGVYADLSKVQDYRESLDKVIAAQNSFNALSSQVRKRFDNDPQKLIEFIADSKNREEAERLGIVNPAPKEPKVDSKVDPK